MPTKTKLILMVAVLCLVGHVPKTIGQFFSSFAVWLHPVNQYHRLLTPDAGIEMTFPPGVPQVGAALRSLHIHEFTISTELITRVRMHLTVLAFPIRVVLGATTYVFAPSEFTGLQARHCQIAYLDGEIGLATCPSTQKL
jgi:hypothetical protein